MDVFACARPLLRPSWEGGLDRRGQATLNDRQLDGLADFVTA